MGKKNNMLTSYPKRVKRLVISINSIAARLGYGEGLPHVDFNSLDVEVLPEIASRYLKVALKLEVKVLQGDLPLAEKAEVIGRLKDLCAQFNAGHIPN